MSVGKWLLTAAIPLLRDCLSVEVGVFTAALTYVCDWCEGYRDVHLVAFCIEERVLGGTVGFGCGDDVELTADPLGFRVLLHFHFDVLLFVEGLLLAGGLCYASGVLSVAVGRIGCEVVTNLLGFLLLGLGLGCRRLVSRVASGCYSPKGAKTATALSG